MGVGSGAACKCAAGCRTQFCVVPAGILRVVRPTRRISRHGAILAARSHRYRTASAQHVRTRPWTWTAPDVDADRPASTSAPDRTPTPRPAPDRRAFHFQPVGTKRRSAGLFCLFCHSAMRPPRFTPRCPKQSAKASWPKNRPCAYSHQGTGSMLT